MFYIKNYQTMYKKIYLIALFFFYPNESYAYLDPGTGSILLQAIFGGIVMGLVTIQIWWKKLKAFLSKIWKKKSKQPES